MPPLPRPAILVPPASWAPSVLSLRELDISNRIHAETLPDSFARVIRSRQRLTAAAR